MWGISWLAESRLASQEELCSMENGVRILCRAAKSPVIIVTMLQAGTHRKLQPNLSSLLNHPLCEGIPVLQPSPLYPTSHRTWSLQSCTTTWYLETLSGIVFKKFMIYFGEELATWIYVVELFNGNLSLFWEFGQPTEVKHFICPTSHYREGFWRRRPGEWG